MHESVALLDSIKCLADWLTETRKAGCSMSDEPQSALSADNIFTAARRLIRNVRADDSGGGFLSTKTLIALETLARHCEKFERMIKEVEKNGGIATITVNWESKT